MGKLEKGNSYTPEKKEKHIKYKFKSNDKTLTINDESDSEKYDLDKREMEFIDFCGKKWSLRKVRHGRLKLLTENDEQYVSVQLKSGDCPEINKDTGAIETERNELRLENENGESTNDDFNFNENYKYKFSFKIPEDFPLSPTRLVIGQWKYNKIKGSNEKPDPNPILAQRIKKIGGKYYFIITDGKEPKNILGKIPFDDIKGKWVDMEYGLKLSDKTDENGKPIPCTVKIKANVEGKRKMDEDKEFYLADENNLKFDSKESHTGYFKFGLYRDTYGYTKDTKNLSEEDKNEIEKAENSEEENPMQIYFKNFSMENLSYQDREQERKESKQVDGEQLEQKKSGLLEDNQEDKILSGTDNILGESYVNTFLSLVGDNKNLHEITENLKNGSRTTLSIKDIENICNNLCEIRSNSKKEYLSDNLGSKQDFKDLSKFCFDPKVIEKYKTFNCSGASLLMASLIESLGGKAYIVSVYHHVVCLAKIGEKEYLIDTLNNKIEDVTDRLTKNRTEVGYVKKFTVNKPIFGQFSEGYIYDTIAQAEKDIHSGNYLKMYEEKYSKVACELEDLIGKEKIDSYIKEGGHGQSYKSFPEFDRKMYEILDLQGKERSYIGKAKLKIQEFFVKLKRFFAKK